MGSILTTNENLLDYRDIPYKGFSFDTTFLETNETTSLYKLQNSVIATTLEYPLGEQYTSLINSTTPYNKITFIISWGCQNGTLELTYYNKDKIVMGSKLIHTGDVSFSIFQQQLSEFITENVYYFSIHNPSFSLSSVTSLTIYGTQVKKNKYSFQLKGIEAIKSTFKMWLFSQKGDYGRKITLGGPLDFILGKDVSTITANEIDTQLREQILKFYNLTLDELIVKPEPELRKYTITMYIRDSYNKWIQPITFELKG